MIAGLLGAFGAAVCYGVGSILQAVAARRTQSAEGLDPRLLIRLFGSWRYLLGIGLDVIAFLLSIAALRSLPLFVVQSIVASFLAVTAVLGAIFLHMPLSRSDWIALLLVIAGLVLIGLSAAEDRAVSVSAADRWGVLVAAAALGVLAVPLGRINGAPGAAALGLLAGLAYGAVAVAARVLPGSVRLDTLFSDLGTLLTDPSIYALILAGGVGLLAYSTALQRGSVTQATAPLVIGETVAPALVGVLMLGDRPRPGWGWAAALGFVLAVAGALSLSRRGDLTHPELQRTP
jgi:drug/metabolite transporter (DMT)-like permease